MTPSSISLTTALVRLQTVEKAAEVLQLRAVVLEALAARSTCHRSRAAAA